MVQETDRKEDLFDHEGQAGVQALTCQRAINTSLPRR